MNPHGYAAAIGRALDAGDLQAATALIGRFAAEHPDAYRVFLPVFQREVLARKQQ